MGKRERNQISRRSLIKGMVASGAIGFIGTAAAQSDTPLASIATDEFSNAVSNTNFTGKEQQKNVFTESAHDYPVDGESYLVMSSGDAENIMGDPETFSSVSANGIKIENYSPDGYVANDVATFVVEFVVPDGAQSVAFDYKFGSEENPSYLDSPYQDFFEAVVFPPDDSPRNIALLPDGDPVTVDNANQYSNSPGGTSDSPDPPYPSSPDTVLNAVTESQTAVWNVSQYQGQQVSMFFRIADASDYVFDSAVLIDNLRFGGDIEETNLARVNAALNEYEDALFSAIDDQVRAMARAEAKYYHKHGSDYADSVIDYFGAKAGVISDPDVDPEVESILDEATGAELDDTGAEELYAFYEAMYSKASQNMTEDDLTTLFAHYYRGTSLGQSTYLTFDVDSTASQSGVAPLAEDGQTLNEIVEFTQDCILGTASTSGLKQDILQELTTSDLSAATVETFASAIEQRASNLNSEVKITDDEYDTTADVLTADEGFKAKLVVPDTDDAGAESENVESQLAVTTGIIGGLSLKAILTGGATKFTAGAIGMGGLGLAGSNALGTISSANSLSASTYTGGQLASAGSALSSAQAIASTQTALHYSRIQALVDYLKLVDTATSTLECGTTAFQDFLNAAKAMSSEADGSGDLPTQDVVGLSIDDISVSDIQAEDQLPNSGMGRATGSVTLSNTGLVSVRPDLSASKIRETVAYTGFQTGSEHPIVFEEIPDIQPGDTETIEFTYLAPVGSVLDLATDYELEIVETQTDASESASFETEATSIDLDVPSSTVSGGTITTGETIFEVVTPSSDASFVTFTLEYGQFDGDLHLYDSQGNHCGFDYTTGEIQNEIPNAVHSGDDDGVTNQEYISVSNPGGSEFEVEVTVEEIGTVTQDVESFEGAGARSTERQSSQQGTVEPMAVSPVDGLATEAGETEFTTTLTELTPQPATMALSPISMSTSESGSITASTTISEVGTFESIQNVDLSVDGDLLQDGGDASIPGENVSFGDDSFTVQAGGGQSVSVTVDVPAGLSAGTFTGTVEASGSSADGTVTETVPLTVDVESDSSGPTPGTVSRTLSTTSAQPGGDVSVTIEAVAADPALSISEQFGTPFGGATLDSLSIEGNSGQTIVEEVDQGGLVVTLGQLSAGTAVTIEYTVTVPGDATSGDTFSITGSYDSGDVSKNIGAADISVQDGPFTGPVADYNTDGDDDIDIIELGKASAAYANGKIGITELGQVAAAYANTS